MNPVVLSSLRKKFFHPSLYLVANRPSYSNQELFISKIIQAVQGGVSCVQLRDHQSDFESVLQLARSLKDRISVPLFLNTRHLFEVALAIDADGVYLEEPYSYFEARKRLGPEKIIGIPVKTMDEVNLSSQMEGLDYLSVKVSASKKTCPKNDSLWGLEGLRKVRKTSPHRIVAIGGLNLECAEEIYRELNFEDGIAMAGGIMDQHDPCDTAKKIRAVWQQAKRKQ